jgi:glutathionyl-hydroquinone reductase
MNSDYRVIGRKPADMQTFNSAIKSIETVLDTYEPILEKQRYLAGDVRTIPHTLLF